VDGTPDLESKVNHNHESTSGGFLRSLFVLILFGLLAIAAFFLIAEHRAHIFGGKWTAPALLIAFVGLHFLMHAGHGGHGGHRGHSGGGHSSRDERQPSKKQESDNER